MFIILAVTQVAGWGVVGFLPVLASSIAFDLRLPLPTVFLGTTIFYATMGLAAPIVGRAFKRFGAKTVMLLGALLIGTGLASLSVSNFVSAYLSSWAVIGVGGAMFLTTAAYVYLSEYANDRARGLIGSLMLVTGLAGSVFWPLTAYLQHRFDWHGIAQIYAAGMILIILPMVFFGIPEARNLIQASELEQTANRRNGIFWLLVAGIALNGFVSYGMESIGIELFQAMGANAALAVGMASFLGVLKVCGRLVDLIGGKRWSAVSTGIVSGGMISFGLFVPFVLGGSSESVIACLLLFGVGSGAFAVARATMPLVFFKKAEYAAAMSVIAIPLNLTSAVAAPVLSGVLTIFGASLTLLMLIAFSSAALCALIMLGTLTKARPLSAM
ncbi:MFS family permease [Rhizobium leguminosarum]|uniref:MFS family permease n=1 Tax=Rhizobium leguminosarum TaxID=384 RepID=A0AAE2MLU5_RHILE|nr:MULTISPECIES: MFS transporter [Rhizobium]MBB4291480.1 MFS family permease [Rhizobium leguminosarum]MBB4296177.1 MFS family permease [Rhizobium leguminosarum]MBB4308564.1 MFS family permease [Rhizobium leguminosarum]MBB4416399.1 MFS family permease [Rhizobium leguminosarum]MBB4430634.1 MFS family permease [Rhizobium esperanzae]